MKATNDKERLENAMGIIRSLREQLLSTRHDLNNDFSIQSRLRRIVTDFYPTAVRVEVIVTQGSCYIHAEYRHPEALKGDCISMRQLSGEWVK